MEIKDGKQAVYMRTRQEWRNWLRENGKTERSVWLILFHKNNDTPSVDRIEATEEALCFGWIDSLCKKREGGSYYLTFSPRNIKRSNWSMPNVERAERMIRQKKMTRAGMEAIIYAKENGRWPGK